MPVTVRLFGALRATSGTGGVPSQTHVEVPEDGIPARDVAERLKLPVERIEGVFVNHRIHPLSAVVRPGDEIAFVPHGTPGPHRFFLGLYEAGREPDGK